MAAGQARKLSDAELTQVRFAAGEKLWRRAIPDEQPVTEQRGAIGLIGNLPPERMASLADTAEDVAGRVRSELAAATSRCSREAWWCTP